MKINKKKFLLKKGEKTSKKYIMLDGIKEYVTDVLHDNLDGYSKERKHWVDEFQMSFEIEVSIKVKSD